jgi:hypothetical protein
MRRGRILLPAVLTAIAASLWVGLPAATAAAPATDSFDGAAVATLGFSDEIDTSEATTDADDVAANADCGAPSTDASVWYSYTAASAGGVIVDVSASSYSAGVIVVSGSPGTFAVEACGPGATLFAAAPGLTYHVIAFDDQGDGGGNGGTLRISLTDAPPPPAVAVSVDPAGYVNGRTGIATISGTVTCSNAEFVDVFTELTQRVGRRATVLGFGGFFADGSICDGTPHAWASEVVPDGGAFAGGSSASFTFSVACGGVQCAFGYSEQTVKLRGGRKVTGSGA